jgi:perosamine synthetase
MNNLQAAMGLAQMEKLDEFIDKKRQIAATYTEGLKDIPNLVLMCEDEHAHSTYWLYTLLVGQLDSRQNSRELIKQMNQLGIHSRPLWLPAHLQKMYRDCLFYGTNCAENLYDLAVQLPSSIGLTDDQANFVLTAIRDNCKQ